MAPRRQAKQAAAEKIMTATADNVSPSKKRKTAAKSTAVNEPKQAAKGRSRQAKTDKQENEVASGPTSPPKKSARDRKKNTASTATAAAKSDTRSRAKKQVAREPQDATAENKNVDKVVEKKTRGGKTVATAKKAGTKTAAAKAKAPAARKQKTRATDEDGDPVRKNASEVPAKRTRRINAVEENDAPAQPAAKVSRKRKYVENTDEAITEVTKEVEEEGEEEENEVKVTGKKPRGRAKKMETDDALLATSTPKGKPKKNSAKKIAKSPPEETEIKKQNGKEQNAALQEDNIKTKNTKKGNVKKPGTRRKLNAVAEKTDEAEEVVILETDIKENGEAYMAEVKQKKRNAGKANAAMNGKVEAKGKQKKGQVVTVSIDEKEVTKDVIAENKTTEMNVASEIDGNDQKDISLSQDDNNLQIDEETNKVDESKADSTKDSNTETSVKEKERSDAYEEPSLYEEKRGII